MSRLTLSVPDPSAAPQAVVRDWNLRVVKHVRAGRPASLPPGRYLVSLPAPGGEETVKSVELARGEHATVVFEDPPVAPGLESVALTPALPWHARPLSGRDGGPLEGFIGAEPDAGGVAVTVSSREAATLVQFAAPGGVPRNVMVPPGWSMHVRLDDGSVVATAVPPADETLTALAAFLSSGQVREAADLGVQAMEMLRQKISNPIGATVGGYALLRMGRLREMRNWPYNLAQWFDWLPDGAVIAAEVALLRRKRKDAAQQLEDAARRGVPLFAEGLSLLGRRVREGLVDTEPARRLAALTPLLELGQLTVTLPGRDPLDPAGSQAPLSEFPADDGWRSFVGAEAV